MVGVFSKSQNKRKEKVKLSFCVCFFCFKPDYSISQLIKIVFCYLPHFVSITRLVSAVNYYFNLKSSMTHC